MTKYGPKWEKKPKGQRSIRFEELLGIFVPGLSPSSGVRNREVAGLGACFGKVGLRGVGLDPISAIGCAPSKSRVTGR